MTAETKQPQLVDPDFFLQIEDLEIATLGIVEGVWQGLRRSPWRGTGAEFETHRDYRPGDDPRHINWALSSRHKRLFTKEYRAETNMPLYLLLDASGSMGIANGPSKKFDYVTRVASAFSWLAQQQRDTTGLAILRSAVTEGLPAKGGKLHLQQLLTMLAATKPSGSGDLAKALEGAREQFRARGLVVLFSDLFDKEDAILHTLRCMRQQGHDVIVFQILDPIEVELPKDSDIEFTDPETGRRLKTSTAAVRDEYRDAVQQWRDRFRSHCEQAGIHWHSATTEEPLIDTVRELLTRRLK